MLYVSVLLVLMVLMVRRCVRRRQQDKDTLRSIEEQVPLDNAHTVATHTDTTLPAFEGEAKWTKEHPPASMYTSNGGNYEIEERSMPGSM